MHDLSTQTGKLRSKNGSLRFEMFPHSRQSIVEINSPLKTLSAPKNLEFAWLP